MRNYIRICLLLIVFAAFQAEAQEKWSLTQCIDYAQDNNLRVQKQLLKIDYDKLQIKQSKDNLLPELSARVSDQMYFGRTLNQSTNAFETINSNSLSMSVGGSVSLFQGFRLKREKEMMLLNLKSSEYSLEQINNDISLSIATSYLDVLQNKELLNILQEQLNVTKEDAEKVMIRYEAGDVSKDVYLEILAQIAREESQLTEAQNNLANSLLILAQILDIKDFEGFDIEIPQLPLIESKVSFISTVEIFESALNLPQIKNAELQIENDLVAIEKAKSGFYPTATLFANYYNSYNNKAINGSLSDSPGSSKSFADQISENPRQELGLNVYIPIFSKFQNRNAVKAAVIQKSNSVLDLEIEKKNLREQIQTAYANAKSSYAKYVSAEEALRATRESSRFSMEKYRVGAISPYDYNTSKSQLLRSEAELLQAKYSFIFTTKVLEFYNGIPLAL